MAETISEFFTHPILNSPYTYPSLHWELDVDGQPTGRKLPIRRPAKFMTPIPKPRKRKGQPQQARMVLDEGAGLSSEAQRYDATSIITSLRPHVDEWRATPDPKNWRVT